MPLTMPLARYFSMPSAVVGGIHLSCPALNWRPWFLSMTQKPSALSHSPELTVGAEPTTVARSRCPFTLT